MGDLGEWEVDEELSPPGEQLAPLRVVLDVDEGDAAVVRAVAAAVGQDYVTFAKQTLLRVAHNTLPPLVEPKPRNG